MRKGECLLTTAILSETGNIPRNNIQSASGLGKVFIIHPPDANPDQFLGVENVPAEPSIPTALNRLVDKCSSEFFAVIGELVKRGKGLRLMRLAKYLGKLV